MPTASFPWAKAKRANPPLLPVFLPFAGCKTRCIYCSQNIQTGIPESKDKEAFLGKALEEAQSMLLERSRKGLGPCELAFFGGTFTAQGEEALQACLDKAKGWMESGLLTSWRCSTRPDCVPQETLERMRGAGCSCVELGIQSFDRQVLEASLRGYEPQTAKEAMVRVLSQGLSCGVQLLPGLPFSTPEGFTNDVETAIGLGADFFRFYPCLVFPGTGLARLYRQGLYAPWSLETTVEALSKGLCLTMKAQKAVVRIGVADEPGLAQKLLAGPFDQAIGTRALSLALLTCVRRALPQGAKAKRISAPKYCQGYFFGEKRERAKDYESLGAGPKNIIFTDGETVDVEF